MGKEGVLAPGRRSGGGCACDARGKATRDERRYRAPLPFAPPPCSQALPPSARAALPTTSVRASLVRTASRACSSSVWKPSRARVTSSSCFCSSTICACAASVLTSFCSRLAFCCRVCTSSDWSREIWPCSSACRALSCINSFWSACRMRASVS
eukprot:4945652-Prymnesium_polylepis.1